MTEVMIQIEDELCTDEVIQFANEAKQCVELYSRKNNDYCNSFDKGILRSFPFKSWNLKG